jgi:hypothetical protein
MTRCRHGYGGNSQPGYCPRSLHLGRDSEGSHAAHQTEAWRSRSHARNYDRRTVWNNPPLRFTPLEQVVAISRAPIFIPLLGYAYHFAGRAEDADRVLREPQERRSRGEFVLSLSYLSIFPGAGDIPASKSFAAHGLTQPQARPYSRPRIR